MGKITEFSRKKTKQQANQKSPKNSPKKAEQTHPSRTKLKHSIISLILVATTAYFAFLLVDQGVKYAQLMETREELEQKIDEAKDDQQDLKQDVERLKDPKYLEILARRKFGFIRDDEILLEVPPEE